MKIIVRNGNLVFQEGGNIKSIIFEDYQMQAYGNKKPLGNIKKGAKYMLVIKSPVENPSGVIIFDYTGGMLGYINQKTPSGKSSTIYMEATEDSTDLQLSVDKNSTGNLPTVSFYEIKNISEHSDIYTSGTGVSTEIRGFDPTKTYNIEVELLYTNNTNTFKIYDTSTGGSTSTILKEVPAVSGATLNYKFTGISRIGFRSYIDMAHIQYKVTEVLV